MKIRNFEDLNLQEVDTMREISSIGTSHAAIKHFLFLYKDLSDDGKTLMIILGISE